MKTLLILFAKEPIEGQVKTRLIPALEKAGACNLYKDMLNTMLKRFSYLPNTDFIIYTNKISSNLTSYFTSPIKYQQGQDIGEKMFKAMAYELHSYDKVILFGADCPFLTTGMVQQVIDELDKHEYVFIPTHDGGYVLIGATQISPIIFKDIAWSTADVMSQTCTQIESLGYSFKLLEPLNDIDNESDLELLTLDEKI